jgi:hypothetical protein
MMFMWVESGTIIIAILSESRILIVWPSDKTGHIVAGQFSSFGTLIYGNAGSQGSAILQSRAIRNRKFRLRIDAGTGHSGLSVADVDFIGFVANPVFVRAK